MSLTPRCEARVIQARAAHELTSRPRASVTSPSDSERGESDVNSHGSRSMSRALRTGCALLGFAVALGLDFGTGTLAAFEARPVVSAVETRDADTVKSAFVYTVAARHVQWPDSAFPDKSSPFVIGVLGPDPIVAALVATVRDRKRNDRRMEVRTIVDIDDAAHCQILFVPANRENDLSAVVDACKGRAVLILGSSEDSVRKGAHIGAFLEKSKLRFAADPSSAKSAGLEIGSELLKLARIVNKSAGGPR